MKTAPLTAVLIALMPGIVMAQKLGDHPAVVVQRLQASAGYDYASKFYPHPAWLHLSAEAPRSPAEEPAQSIAAGPDSRPPATTAAETSLSAGASAVQAVSATPVDARR